MGSSSFFEGTSTFFLKKLRGHKVKMVVDFCDYFWVSNEFLNALFKSCFFATDGTASNPTMQIGECPVDALSRHNPRLKNFGHLSTECKSVLKNLGRGF